MQTGGIVGDSSGDASIGQQAIYSQVPIDILTTLKAFKESVTSQLSNLTAEFSVGVEDLEIDDEEFAERIKDGSLSFKAVLMNIGVYMHATFNEIARALDIAGLDFSDDVSLAVTPLQTTFDTFDNDMVILISKINTAITDIGGIGSGFNTIITDLNNLDFSYMIDEIVSQLKSSLGNIFDNFFEDHPMLAKVFGVDTDKRDKGREGPQGDSGSSNPVIVTPPNPPDNIIDIVINPIIGDIIDIRDDPSEDKGVPFLAKGGIFKSPSLGMFGEAGAEAIIPLEGSNKKFGANLLSAIIPEYYPEMMNAGGAIYGGDSYNRAVTHSAGDSYAENYNIMGPVNVASQDPIDFMNKMKSNYRASPTRR